MPSQSLRSPAGQAQKPADRPKLAAVPAGMLLAAEHAAEPAVVVQNLSGAPDHSQHQDVDTEHLIAGLGCAMEPAVAVVLAHA